jgi:hypothetical protein
VAAPQSQSHGVPGYWPSARHFTEAMQCPSVCFTNPYFKQMLPAVDRLGMPLVTSGQFAYVYKLKSGAADYAVRCFRGYLGDRDSRYKAIQAHLRQHPVPFLSEFQYEPEGILVGGNRYPIISMNWIEGPTLDLYLERMIKRKEVLLHLADEWLRLVKSLKDAGVAHGDLQHGNIIVDGGNLCLIDHDGIFVPAMESWVSSEVGHQHYQHPQRDAQHFDATLDNFSALVIYLSLISLAEEPELWNEYHDENLIFTKSDFLEPAASALFAKIREIGPEHQRLANVLVEGTKHEPLDVPCVLDLVTVKSALPTWMTAPADLNATTKTREVVHPQVVPAGPKWVPWQAKRAASNVPATPPSSTVQTLFGPPPPLSSTRDPSAIYRNTPHFAKELLKRTFLWWYWGLYVVLKIIGLDFFSAFLVALFFLAATSLTYGFIRAQQLANAAKAKALSTGPPPPPITWQRGMASPSSITVPESIIGNAALNIFHRKDCDWVKHISPKNRISFSSVMDASSAGFKACQVCSAVIKSDQSVLGLF